MALDPIYLKATCRGQSDWLNAWALELESGRTRMIRRMDQSDVDVSPAIALDYRARAATLESIVEAYDQRGMRTIWP
ncbi:MAG: hypothetical protein ACREFW_02735 [Rhizomicrobium sp.]